MRYRGLCLILICLCLAALAGCQNPASEDSTEKMDASFVIGDEYDNSMIIIGGENGIIGQYPEGNWGEYEEPDWTEPTEPPEVMVDLPDGTQVPEGNVQTLEDGTIVVRCNTYDDIYYHKCFYADGTYAITDYYSSEHECCNYEDAAMVWVEWYLENGSEWKDEEYIVKADGELFLRQRYEYEYTQVEIGNEESPWYHSATNELFYDEEYGDYKTARAEFDPLHGSEKPIKWTYYDGSYSEHEYNLDGSKKKEIYYSANGKKTQADFYENDQLITQYLFREDGSQQFVRHYKDGVITSENYYAEGGYYYDITYYENGYRTYTLGQYDDGRSSSTHYDESGCAVKFLSNAADGSLEWYALYENYPDGSLKIATYYDPDGRVTKVEEYDKNGNLIE